VLYIVSVTVLVAIRGYSVGEGGNIIIYIASRPKRTQVDKRLVLRDVKARELD
jgi:hypothetical protein